MPPTRHLQYTSSFSFPCAVRPCPHPRIPQTTTVVLSGPGILSGAGRPASVPAPAVVAPHLPCCGPVGPGKSGPFGPGKSGSVGGRTPHAKPKIWKGRTADTARPSPMPLMRTGAADRDTRGRVGQAIAQPPVAWPRPHTLPCCAGPIPPRLRLRPRWIPRPCLVRSEAVPSPPFRPNGPSLAQPARALPRDRRTGRKNA